MVILLLRAIWSTVMVICLLCGIDLVGQVSQAFENISICDTVVLSSPRGKGVSYKGTVRNSDYQFSAVIPPGLTGWGAGPGAPFHGFVIYFAGEDKPQSCIDFSVGIHVRLPEEEETSSGKSPSSLTSHGRKVKIGNKVGVETLDRGFKDGVSIDNIWVVVHLDRQFQGARKQLHDTVDVGVLLVTPTNDRDKTEPVFRKFLSQLKFQ